MSIDLSAAVEAAYRAHHVARRGRDLAPGEYEATYSRIEVEWLTAAVTAAAPLIEAQVREAVAREIETMRSPITVHIEYPDVAWAMARQGAARIARGAA